MASDAHPHFLVHRPAEYVAHVEINRPAKMNSFHDPMWAELQFIFDTLSADSTVRAIVLSGAGDRAFTSGLDVAAAASSPTLGTSAGDPARKATGNRRHIDALQASVTAVERCEKPVISVLHGYSFGLAIDLSSATDVRVCTADAKMCVKEVDIGLAADVGTLTRLPKVVGSHSWVKDVSLSARVFGAEEAARVGYVSAVYPTKQAAVAAALDWARLVAAKSPVAVQGTKELLNYSRDHTTAEGLRYTSVWNSVMLQTSDVPAALKGGATKRVPTFEKL